MNNLSDDNLITEIKKRGLFDSDGLVKWPVYQLGVDILPIPCADVVLVKKFNNQYKIGVIIRATGSEAGKMAITGGRVKKDQRIIDAISRHLLEDLSIKNWKFVNGNNEQSPFYLQQYFQNSESNNEYGFDPSKHAIAMTYLIETDEDPFPKNEANKFLWISEDQIPKETAYNHGEVMRQAFNFLKNIQ